MYIRRKLYSNIEGEKVPVEQTTLFSAKDDVKGAAKGAGIVAGTAGLGAAGLYGAKKATDKAVSKAIANKNAFLKGEIAGDFEKLDAAHEKAAKASGKVNRVIKSGKDWINNAEGKAEAEAYKAKIAGKSGAAKAAMEKKLGTLEKTANKIARNRKIGVGLAAAGTLAAGAGAGVGISRLKGKKAEEKTYSVLMTEEQLRIFAEVAKDAGIGAGVATGAAVTAGGAALAGKKIGEVAEKAKKSLTAARKVAHSEAQIAADKARQEFKEKGTRKAEKAVDKTYKKMNKLSKEAQIEKGLEKIAKGGAAATKWVKANPKLAAGIAAGTVAAGAGVGAGVGAIKDKK